MMNVLIDCALRNTLSVRKEEFGENCTFISFESESDGENFSWTDGVESSARFGRIIYRRNGQREYSNHLVLKVIPPFGYLKEFTLLQFFEEVFFYTRILPFFETFNAKISRLFPKYYNSLLQYNVHSDEVVIVFQNLQASGYLPAKKKSFLDYDHLSLMMKKLGEFHAYSYRALQDAPDKFYAMTLCMVETNGNVLKEYPSLFEFLSRGFEHLETEVLTESISYHYRSKIGILRDLIDRCDDVLTNALTGDKNNPTHVLCHGDFIRNNILFKYDEGGKPTDLKMVDLGTWRFASPVTDLATVLYLNADQKMRDENWDNLIDDYYSALRDTFPSVIVPSKDSILAEFRTNVMVAYFIASNRYLLAGLISADNDDVPKKEDLVPKEYRSFPFTHFPDEVLLSLYAKEGGEKATTALTDILKDFIDRCFI